MAQRGIQLDQEKLCCAICLDLLKDPVTIPCGHNYCMNCIRIHWDEEDQKHTHSCPQCRQTFVLRPALVKNTMLAELVEELKKTGLHAAPADHYYAGAADVACDFCTGRKLKAIKSCLQCLVSYCEQHLQPHYESPAFEKHKLVDSSKRLKENICSHHDEVMKIFCRTDQLCICYLCSMDEHRGHETVSAAAERKEKQRELEVSQQNIQLRIKEKEKDMKVLQQEVEAISQSADKAVKGSEKIFTDLIQFIEKRSSDLKQQIRSKQDKEVSRVRDLQKKLQQELNDLRRNDTELGRLSHTPDHIQFLQSYPLLSSVSKSTNPLSSDAQPLRYFDDVTVVLSEVRGQLQDVLKEGWSKISLTVTEADVLLLQPQSQPQTRAEFLQYSRQLTLDPNTAHKQLLLSEGNRKATVMRETQLYPDHPDRFTLSQQVLSRESLTGRCYWEVQVEPYSVFQIFFKDTVAVAYKCRGESEFGYNNRSWAVQNPDNFIHNSVSTSLSGPWSSRIGVYLDHRAGILSFYSISETSETMTLLHRVQTTFTEPLYAGFNIYDYDRYVKLCDLK